MCKGLFIKMILTEPPDDALRFPRTDPLLLLMTDTDLTLGEDDDEGDLKDDSNEGAGSSIDRLWSARTLKNLDINLMQNRAFFEVRFSRFGDISGLHS